MRIPANTQFVSASGVTTHSVSGSTVRFQPLASLGAKDKASWRVVLRGAKPADARFRVSMTSAELGKIPVEETEATNYYE